MSKTLIAAADSQAMTSVLQGHLAKRTAGTGLLDKDSEFITAQVIDDHKEYAETLQNVLTEDKTEAFAPNDELLD